MDMPQTIDAHGELRDPTTLVIRRLLPGPIERIWAYLTDSTLRRQWLAAGEMVLMPDAAFELVWHNDRLSDGPDGGTRPEGFGWEQRMTSRIIAVDAPHSLTFSWGASGEVAFTLVEKQEQVLLTVTHRRLGDRAMLLNVSAGWHAHLDTLAEIAQGLPRQGFWSRWSRLKADYEQRLPA